MHRFCATLFVLLLLALPGAASAQLSNQKLAEINRVAMEAYNNLDIETARSTLEDAVRKAESSNTHGPALARTYANLGVIVIGGLGDNNAGVDAFVHALKEDPNVEPDPIVATPEVMVAFATAKKKAGAARGGSAARNPSKGVEGNLSHEPAAEQLSQTAVPVFVSKSGVNADKVRIFYRSLGMSKPKSADMKQVEGGWAYLIPCTDVFEPTVEYFIVAEDDDGDQVGNAGTPEHPVAVPIVSTRTQEAPSLPGQEPPTQCGASGSLDECPPGLPGCRIGTAQLGDVCRSNSDCASGLRCEDDFCTTDDGSEPSSSDSSAGPKWFLDVGIGMGATIVGSGMTADRAPPKYRVDEAALAQSMAPDVNPDDNIQGDPAAGQAYLKSVGYDCDWNQVVQPGGAAGVEATNCKVAVKDKGLVPVLMLNIAAGRYLSPRWALALWARLQIGAGMGPLAGMTVGARTEYLLTKPALKGFHAGAILGLGIGTIQAKPPSKIPDTPFATSAPGGGVGVVSTLGVRMGYRFNRYIGILVTPGVTMGFPRFMTSLDLSAGVAASF
jgi:hypothetical protein